jgi:hypothetical protein
MCNVIPRQYPMIDSHRKRLHRATSRSIIQSCAEIAEVQGMGVVGYSSRPLWFIDVDWIFITLLGMI